MKGALLCCYREFNTDANFASMHLVLRSGPKTIGPRLPPECVQVVCQEGLVGVSVMTILLVGCDVIIESKACEVEIVT